MIMDIRTKTKQTTATAQVGVCSRDLPPPSPAMILASWSPKSTILSSQKELDKKRSIEPLEKRKRI